MNEQQFSAWLRKQLPGYVDRIENSIGSGMPDMHWAYEGHSRWIETKVMTGGRILLRKEQYAWGMSRAKHRISVYVVTCALILEGERDVWVHKFPLECVRYGKYMAINSATSTIVPMGQFHFSLLTI